MIRYFGAFGPHARDRRALTGSRPKNHPAPALQEPPPAPAQPAPPPSNVPFPVEDLTLGAPPPDPDRSPRLDWASLLQRVHKFDVLACSIGCISGGVPSVSCVADCASRGCSKVRFFYDQAFACVLKNLSVCGGGGGGGGGIDCFRKVCSKEIAACLGAKCT